MLYRLNYIHHVWDCKCTDFFRVSKNILQEMREKAFKGKKSKNYCYICGYANK